MTQSAVSFVVYHGTRQYCCSVERDGQQQQAVDMIELLQNYLVGAGYHERTLSRAGKSIPEVDNKSVGWRLESVLRLLEDALLVYSISRLTGRPCTAPRSYRFSEAPTAVI